MKVLICLVLLSLTAFAQPAPVSQAPKLDASAIYEKVLPAVVVIVVAKAGGQISLGSGVIVSSDGLIATNQHVVRDAISAEVYLRNGDTYDEVTIIDTDERKDLALIRIKAVSLPAVSVANSDDLKVGTAVHVIGAPRGLDGTLSSGIVSSIRRGDDIGPALAGFRLIQFTAAISPGNSGGPILDESARLVGIVRSYRPDGQNLNFGVPSNYLAGMMTAAPRAGQALAKMPQRAQEASQQTTAVTRTPAEIIASAKTLCVWQRSGDPGMKIEINAKLAKWGKLNMTSIPEEADLVFELVQTGMLIPGDAASAVSGAGLLRDLKSGLELWSVRKGGFWAISGWSAAKRLFEKFS